MKLTQLITLLLIHVGLMAQISEQEVSMSQGTYSALVVDMDGINAKGAEKIWKKYAKQYGKVLRDKKNKEHYILDAVIPAIDPEYAVSVFVKLEEHADMTRANLFVKSDGEFANSTDHTQLMRGAGEFLTAYADEVSRVVIGDELKSEEKNLKGLEKDLSKLEKRKTKLEKDIEKAKEVIRKSEEELKQNAKDQEAKKEEIKGQKETVSDVTKKLEGVGKDH